MSRQVFSASRGDMIPAASDIFPGPSAPCFGKEKHAFTFQNNVNTLDRGVEGGLDSKGPVSFRCFRAARQQISCVALVFCRLPSSGREGRPF